jgi:hypothetical protein
MDYEKCTQRLTEIVEITDSQKLNALLSGRTKYHPDTLQVLPFEGISVIHNITPETANALGLSGTIKNLKFNLRQAHLDSKIAFVDTKSFHATTFDLINEVEHGKTLQVNGYDYQQVRNQVQQATLQFLAEMNLKLTATVNIVGVGMFCPSVLKLDLQFPEVVTKVFQAYRRALHEYLGERVGNAYALVRDSAWNRNLSGHITLGYVVKPLTVQEIDPFLRIIREFNERFIPIDFDLTQGEVTAFTDMDHYFVVRGGK